MDTTEKKTFAGDLSGFGFDTNSGRTMPPPNSQKPEQSAPPCTAPKTQAANKATTPDDKPGEKDNSKSRVYDAGLPPDKDIARALPIRAMFDISQEIEGAYKNNIFAKLFLSKNRCPLDFYRLMAEATLNEFRDYSRWLIAGQVTENMALSQMMTSRIFDVLSSEPEKIRELFEIKRLCDEQARAAVELGLKLSSLPSRPAAPVQINLSAAAGIRQDVTVNESNIQDVQGKLIKKKE